MVDKSDATTKDAEGHQIQGKAKKIQASAMKTAADLKGLSKSVVKDVNNAAETLAEDLR